MNNTSARHGYFHAKPHCAIEYPYGHYFGNCCGDPEHPLRNRPKHRTANTPVARPADPESMVHCDGSSDSSHCTSDGRVHSRTSLLGTSRPQVAQSAQRHIHEHVCHRHLLRSLRGTYLSRELIFTEGTWSRLVFDFQWPSVVYAMDILAWDIFFPLAALSAAGAVHGAGLAGVARNLLLASAALAFIGLAGVPVASMNIRNIGIIGYVVLFPIATVMLSIVLKRDAARGAG